MSKELVGNNSKIVGSIEYFNKLSENTLMGEIVKNYDFNYYSSLKDMCSKVARLLDEVYNDLIRNESYLSCINRSNVNDTIRIINGYSNFCRKYGSGTSTRDRCVQLIVASEKPKSDASQWDVRKSAEFVLSNNHFGRNDSIKILEDYIKNGERTIKGDSKKEHFIKDISRSNRSGYLNDVLIKVKYVNSNIRIVGSCGKVLCSREYNEYLMSVFTGSKKYVGYSDYEQVVKMNLKSISDKLNDDINKGVTNNDYIKYPNVENLVKFIDDLAKCGEYVYNLLSKVNNLNWFVGGDYDKILKLQRKINSKGKGTKVLEDEVYGYHTEKAWKEYIEEAIKIALLPAPLKVKYAFDNYNFVIGYGGYVSGHFLGALSVGVMVYIDDDYNVAIMFSESEEITIDPAAVAAGVKGEVSLDAENVNSMSGDSYVIDAGASTPIVEIGVGGGFSRSFDGKTTSYSGGISGGLGLIPVDFNIGTSHNKSLIQFNAVEWLKSSLNIK